MASISSLLHNPLLVKKWVSIPNPNPMRSFTPPLLPSSSSFPSSWLVAKAATSPPPPPPSPMEDKDENTTLSTKTTTWGFTFNQTAISIFSLLTSMVLPHVPERINIGPIWINKTVIQFTEKKLSFKPTIGGTTFEVSDVVKKSDSTTPLEVSTPPPPAAFREAAPLHFLFKVELFSMLSKNSVVKCESNEFETGGYKWKLSLYPDGNKNENGNGYISLYLVLVDSQTSLPAAGWELNVLFRLFLFDQIHDRYLVCEDTKGRPRRFTEMKTVWGFPQFLSLAKFKDPGKGFLVDDTCVFGAEVFIAKPPGNIDCLSMVKEASKITFTWEIKNFSEIKEEYIFSEKFKAGDHNWNVLICPKGNSVGKDNSVSLFLNLLVESNENPAALKVFTFYKLRVRDQINGKHIEKNYDGHWFCVSSNLFGWPKFIELSEMNKKGNGYLVNDTCIVEVEVKVLGVVSKRP